jgi:CRISPR-associated protein Cas5h
MEVITFKIEGDYALFKKPFANNQPQSFIVPPKTAILGMVGAILGFEKNEYIEKLGFDRVKYGVKLLNRSISKELFGINLMNLKNIITNFDKNPIRNGNHRTPTRFEVLKDIEYQMFLHFEDKSIGDEFYQRLSENRFEFEPFLGMAGMFMRVSEVEKIEASKEINSDIIYTSFENSSIDFKIGDNHIYIEKLPYSMDSDRDNPELKKIVSFTGEIEASKIVDNSNFYSSKDGLLCLI